MYKGGLSKYGVRRCNSLLGVYKLKTVIEPKFLYSNKIQTKIKKIEKIKLKENIFRSFFNFSESIQFFTSETAIFSDYKK